MADAIQRWGVRDWSEQNQEVSHVRRRWFVASRALFGAMTLTLSSYFVLAAFTASYFGIGPMDLTEGVRFIVRWFPLFYWLAVSSVVTTLAPLLRSRYRRLAAGWVLAMGIGGAALHYWGLPAAPGDYRSFIWAAVVTFPAAWLGLMDVAQAVRSLPRSSTTTVDTGLRPAFVAAVCVSGAFALRAALLAVSAMGGSRPALSLAALAGITFTVAIVVAVLSIIALMQRAALRLGGGDLSSLAVSAVAWWGIFAVAIRRVIAPALSFNNSYADLWAALLPIGFVLLLAGTSCMASASASRALHGGPLGLFCVVQTRRAVQAGLAIAVVIAGLIGVGAVAPLDWQSVFQHLIAMSMLLLSAALVTSAAKPTLMRSRWLVLIAAASVGIVFSLADIARASVRILGPKGASVASLYVWFDPLMDSLQQAARPPFRDSAAEQFFATLRANSSIREPIKAPRIEIGPLNVRPMSRPDIYIIVADSLRQDFVAPYSADDNTPEIRAFAQDSVVFSNAFTSFAGTTLSEPCIWMGASLIEHQYPEPFADINVLEKLTTADGYVRLIARDPVLDVLLQRRAGDRNIGQGLKYWTDLTAEVALGQVQSELREIPKEQPVFVYVQPQDLHEVTLSIRGSRNPGFRQLPFRQQYSIGVKEIDRAFGNFIAELKRSGRYENSIIVLTADHGDGIGDYGRWGHSDSVLPNVVRVPLIVHLPAAARGMKRDTERVATLADIAPSLYYLLGHRPLSQNPLIGRPPFTESEAEQQQYAREYEVLGNSYSPVFAVVDREAKTMFMADAGRQREAFFDLKTDPNALRNLISPDEQRRGEQRIREHLQQVNRFYGYSPKVQ